MEKRKTSQLLLLLSTGVLLTACATDTEEAPTDTEPATTEEVGEVAEEEAVAEETTEEKAAETEEAAADVNVFFDIVIDGEAMADLSQDLTVPEGTYLLDAMKKTYALEEEGGFISAIEGYEQDADAGRYWLYSINGEMPSVGAADYELEAEDEIEWRLEDSE